jgi:hypothetical protein
MNVIGAKHWRGSLTVFLLAFLIFHTQTTYSQDTTSWSKDGALAVKFVPGTFVQFTDTGVVISIGTYRNIHSENGITIDQLASKDRIIDQQEAQIGVLLGSVRRKEDLIEDLRYQVKMEQEHSRTLEKNFDTVVQKQDETQALLEKKLNPPIWKQGKALAIGGVIGLVVGVFIAK